MSKETSQWQQKITGEWYGIPSVFDAQGQHTGFNKVNRTSIAEEGKTTYYMSTSLDTPEPLRSRFEAQGFAFGVKDSDQDRIYMGPDFFGAGQPYGSLVDAHYYSPGWQADLRTMVHILEDGETQVYSSLLYEGPTIIAVFNGLYKMATDYDTNLATKARIDQFIDEERILGRHPHILPMKHKGEFKGKLAVYDRHQTFKGDNFVRIEYSPKNLLEADITLTMEGVFNKRAHYSRSRHGHRHAFDGPDLCGNGIAYGRALYTSQHFKGEALRLSGREFIIDNKNSMSVVWQLQRSGAPDLTLFGVLEWEEQDLILPATY